MNQEIPDFVVCREEPVVTKISDEHYMVVYRRDIGLTIVFAEEVKKTNQLLSTGLKTVEDGQSQEGEATGPPATDVAGSQDEEIAKPQVARKKATDAPKWKITDRESRIIEYYGQSVRFSKTQFGVLEALILADGMPVSYPDTALAGWGEPTDRRTVEATIYQLNKFLMAEKIDEFISCRDGHMLLIERLASDAESPKKPSKKSP